jgi:hypothetical protein
VNLSNLQEEATMKDKARRKFLKQSIGLGAAGTALLARPMSAAAYSRVLGSTTASEWRWLAVGMGRGDLRDFLKVKNVMCGALRCGRVTDRQNKQGHHRRSLGCAGASRRLTSAKFWT